MLDRFTVLFSLGTISYGLVLILALAMVVRRRFGSTGFWLSGYAVSAIYGDYNLGLKMRDKALGTTLAMSFTLSPTIDFIVDLCGRVALLVAIWLFITFIGRQYHGNRI